MSDCIFCKIIKGEIPSEKIYEDEKILVIKDINPVAPVHVLIMPKEHIADMNGFDEMNRDLAGEILLAAKKAAKILKVDKEGYRLINNCGAKAGQTVMHVHFHLIAGINMPDIKL